MTIRPEDVAKVAKLAKLRFDDTKLERFAGQMPIAPVFDIAQALDNPYVERIGMLQSVDHPQGAQRMLRNPIKLDGKRLDGVACPPLSADADALLAELGYSAEDRARLVAQGVV